MSPRGPHDALTRLLPGADNYMARRAIRRLLDSLVSALPPGIRLRVASTGWEASSAEELRAEYAEHARKAEELRMHLEEMEKDDA